MRLNVVLLTLLLSAVASSATAQIRPPVAVSASTAAPTLSLRPFFVYAGEQFTAHQTFDAVFGQPFQPLYGGGLQVVFRSGFYIDVTASRFKKTGQRAFFFEGQGFPLGIPLTATLTPFEVSAGGRFRGSPRFFPYVGVGVGTYRYQESSEFDDGGDFDVRHVGYLIVGGAEFRLGRWVAVSGDLQFTRVPGILGEGGVSKETGETDLGGTAGRFRIIVGR